MKILIIGGTIFVGRHLVEAAQARGHDITLFNRGKHNPDIFPNVETVRGDRDGELSKLDGRQWDAVIDTCGYVPRVVRTSAHYLADKVDRYVFISSISVYADFTKPNTDETSPVATLEDETVEQVTGETYGALKALCEQAVEAELPGRTLNIRPGLIVGPHDPTDRFTYWPVRIDRGGDVLAPGRPERTVQFIDARDLADWTIRMIEAGKTGIYNADGPDHPQTMQHVLETCRRVCGSDANFHWIDADFLKEHEVQPWMEMPLWIPGADDAVNCQKAIQDGLTYRPLDAIVADTLAWARTRPADYIWRAGLKAEKEEKVLNAWQSRE